MARLQPPENGSTPKEMAIQLLDYNHETYHVFFSLTNGVLLHNHLAHHILTLYALGASPDQIRWHFRNNESYQRKRPAASDAIIDKLADPTVFAKCLGNELHYSSFLQFFTQHFELHGYEESVKSLLFDGTELANLIFSRLFTGFIHPLIQLGFGIEFDRQDLMVEALVMACTQNDPQVADFLLEVERKSEGIKDTASLVELLDLCATNEELLKNTTTNMFHLLDEEGILGRARDKLLGYASRFVVAPEECHVRSAELCNATGYILTGAQRSGKPPRMDFFLMHATNVSVMIDAAIHKEWMTPQSSARLLTWFGRFCVVLYVVVGAPKLDLKHIRELKPADGAGGWEKALKCAIEYPDDGHGCKMVRALAHAEVVSRPYEGRPEFRMKGKDFEQGATAVVESFLDPEVVERAGPDQFEAWVRLAGFDSAWEKIPDLPPEVT